MNQNDYDKPTAYAQIKGNSSNSKLEGIVYFYSFAEGTMLLMEVANMPHDSTHPYAVHIHEGSKCEGDDFTSAGDHYNPTNAGHPSHAGDLPPIFSNDGYSYMTVYTNRFKPNDVIGRTIIIHGNADDFKTQPSGNSGPRIACGEIKVIDVTN